MTRQFYPIMLFDFHLYQCEEKLGKAEILQYWKRNLIRILFSIYSSVTDGIGRWHRWHLGHIHCYFYVLLWQINRSDSPFGQWGLIAIVSTSHQVSCDLPLTASSLSYFPSIYHDRWLFLWQYTSSDLPVLDCSLTI